MFRSLDLVQIFPDMLKQAFVQPLLKKLNLDPNVLQTGISYFLFNLICFLKVVLYQLNNFLDENKICVIYQFSFRKKHLSTETALVKVFNDLLQGPEVV